jgi:L-ascorbate metabolism protein UlaG (beta-lactamase superfamily)
MEVKAYLICMLGMAVASGIICPDSGAESEYSRSHHTEHGFRNIDGGRSSGFVDFLKWQWERLTSNRPNREAPQFQLYPNDPASLKSNKTRPSITWIGHATVLVQLGGKNILTDPQFSDRASPVQFVGPKRVIQPGIALEDLPPIDFVLISHDHYDSLDTESVKRLRERQHGASTVFFVPLGLEEWFHSVGVTNVVELDWWETRIVGDLEIICVPVHHWSQRVPFVRNKTLWSGWVVKNDSFKFLFSGDSGYSPLFKEIGKKFGPFDLATIPIGAYEPRWFMAPHHISPEEAVQVHRDVKSKKSVGIHWGTFVLSDEPLDEPPQELEEAKKTKGVASDEFIVLQHGETLWL